MSQTLDPADDAITRIPFIALLQSMRRLASDFVAFAGPAAAGAGLLVAAGALLEGVGLFLLVPLLGVVTASSEAGGRFQASVEAIYQLTGAATRSQKLGVVVAGFCLIVLVRALVISARDVVLARLQISFVEFQRANIVERLSAAAWGTVSRLRHARIAHLMSGDIQRIGAAVHVLIQCFVAGLMLLMQCVLAFVLSPPLALLAFILLALGGFSLVPVLRRSHGLGAFVTNANLELLNITSQFLGGLKLAIGQNLQSSFADEFRNSLRHLTGQQIEYVTQQTKSRVALATLSSFAGAAVVLIGVGLLDLAPAVLITLLLVLVRMSGPAMQFQQGSQLLAHSVPAYDKVKQLEAELVPPVASIDRPETIDPGGIISFDHVSFRHPDAGPDGTAGLHDLTLTVKPATFVCITGDSGAGKTTFADLLVGLLEPQSGAVTIAGVPLAGGSVAAWRENVSYISQDPFLFHDTIRRNLSWARSDATEQQMWQALGRAGADGLVRAMPRGLDSLVGERGSLVSGGERQRIALARALLRVPKLLILDEATNAIDIAGERQILTRLTELTPRPTIIMIAHRSESLGFCDKIVVLQSGRQIET